MRDVEKSLFLNAKEDARPMTRKPSTLASLCRISSDIPSQKVSKSGSVVEFTNGSTAIAWLLSAAATVGWLAVELDD